MSCYGNMFGEGKAPRRFLWEVNEFGEIVVSRLGKDGNRQDDFVVMADACAILDWLSESGFFVAEGEPWTMCDDCDTWQHVCDVLNGDDSPEKAIAHHVIDCFDCVAPIRRDPADKKWKTTEKSHE